VYDGVCCVPVNVNSPVGGQDMPPEVIRTCLVNPIIQNTAETEAVF
jgi:hypothetical protein